VHVAGAGFAIVAFREWLAIKRKKLIPIFMNVSF
jgi:hypothetical protein